MMSHTPGLLQQGQNKPEYLFPEGDLKNIYAVAECYKRTEEWGREYPAAANATRMLACWNAMVGVEDPIEFRKKADRNQRFRDLIYKHIENLMASDPKLSDHDGYHLDQLACLVERWEKTEFPIGKTT
jgi:hypothetical protein